MVILPFNRESLQWVYLNLYWVWWPSRKYLILTKIAFFLERCCLVWWCKPCWKVSVHLPENKKISLKPQKKKKTVPISKNSSMDLTFLLLHSLWFLLNHIDTNQTTLKTHTSTQNIPAVGFETTASNDIIYDHSGYIPLFWITPLFII